MRIGNTKQRNWKVVLFFCTLKYMQKFSTAEIRKKYLEFFKQKEHTVIPSASLIPENDPTVLFTTAGMHPLVPFLLGEKHPGGNKITSCQKCIRTGDIDEVGDESHLTFFEMLGNWSFGDYFKKEAIEMSFEFLTSKEWLGLDKNLLAVSVFAGDADAPFDEEAFEKWKSLGIPEKRIAKLLKKNNWWGPAGQTGPCGPDTEMFYWTGNPNEVPESFNDDNVLWVEIWNDVFMEYNKQQTTNNQQEEKGYEFVPLTQKNVDTGMGLERVVSILNKCDIYQIDTGKPIIEIIEKLSGKEYGKDKETTRAMRIIADHIRAAVFILGDERGIVPSNVGQGYVLRRLIRRAVRYGNLLGVKILPGRPFSEDIAEKIINIFQEQYSELAKNRIFIRSQLVEEEKRFCVALDRGLKEFKEIKEKIFGFGCVANDQKILYGQDAFYFYQTFGFPKELMQELCKEESVVFDESGFDEELKKHQELSRTASAGMFKGGLADHSEITTKYHTATHLLLAALRQVLGPDIYQKGSNITAERMRFDFNYPEKLTQEQIKTIEDLVNEKIKQDISVEMKEMQKSEALKFVKVSFDPLKYGDTVKVYRIGDFSIELCGGPHVSHTGEIGTFKIVKEEAVSAGVRRIRAVCSA